MDFESEEALKEKLGIQSWRQMSKERMITFVSEMPNMSKEVALKVIDQFPDFRGLVMDSLTELQRQAEGSIKINWKSQKKVHKAFQHYREMLDRELARDNLSSEDRFAVMRLFAEAVDKEAAKDSEHKAFVMKATTVVATVAVVTIGAGAAVLGVKGKVGDAD